MNIQPPPPTSDADIPAWAIERAFRLSGLPTAKAAEFRNGSLINGREYFKAFARYIAEHEEPPPVDPLLEEARELCAINRPVDIAKEFKRGTFDDDGDVRLALRALKRGKELAKEPHP